jgi:hypothetical protein
MNIPHLTLVIVVLALASDAGAQQTTFSPTRGQSTHRQEVDDTTCTRKAVTQTGFDPGMAPPPPSSPDTKDPLQKQRVAFAKVHDACMKGLGYTVK